MSIRPPSDLVMDVVRAADPTRAAAASARLARAEAAVAPQATAQADMRFDAAMRLASGKPTLAPAAKAAGDKNAVGQGLEELLMRQLLQDALPKKAASVYGAGTAGDVWRGLFAEQLSHALSTSGRVGLASRLVQTKPGSAV